MKVVIPLICVIALAAAALIFGHSALAAALTRLDFVLAAIALVAGLARWRVVARRRAKHRLDQMRHSALW